MEILLEFDREFLVIFASGGANYHRRTETETEIERQNCPEYR